LVTEAVQKYQHLVLLGDPGSGKSTFLRHLAWSLAQRGLDQLSDVSKLHGWDDMHCVLPIILPLRTLSGRLAQKDISNTETVIITALRDELQRYDIAQMNDLLSEALHQGTVLLLCDGLDEVPLDAVPGVVSRLSVLQALQDFVQIYDKITIAVTCRIRALDDNLRTLLGWHVETIVPFTLGQVRHFISAWYDELAASGQINQEQASRLQQHLMNAIVGNQKLQDLSRTPLLLTMMALVLYNKNELPRDRPQLYERILELLLGQWDKVRDGQSLSEAIGQSDWGSERIRPVLDKLSYEAHAAVSSADGRGRLTRSAIRDALIDFFETARLPDAWEAARRCLDYFEQRSGLLLADENDTYVFAHLTLQEHCAGRHMLLHRDAVRLVMQYRTDDRWREPIFLGIGVIQQTKPELIDCIFTDLIDRDEGNRPKLDDCRQRDLILAAEIGKDRDWNYLRTQQVNVDRLQRDLKQGLVQLLQDKRQLLTASERIRAGFLLGDLGDPRFPVTIEEWQKAVEQALRGDTNGYFCWVEPGTYTIGSADDDPNASDAEKPQHTINFDLPYLIARYPITNAQWLEWVKAGGGEKNEEYKFTNGSAFYGVPDFMHPNQPYCGAKSYTSEAFCSWLSKQTGYMIHLPNEHEWEMAARGREARLYPWGDIWQEECVLQDRGSLGLPKGQNGNIPVGCYPAGSAPCGALDMVGNVFEVTITDESIVNKFNSFPTFYMGIDGKSSNNLSVIRGAWAGSTKSDFRCSIRYAEPPGYHSTCGFRVALLLDNSSVSTSLESTKNEDTSD
jgi:formylglycine-generating enzyme required for sulfatase activity/energy-coupling factor transporter ATP-binding protein EcfA2